MCNFLFTRAPTFKRSLKHINLLSISDLLMYSKYFKCPRMGIFYLILSNDKQVYNQNMKSA